MKIPDDVARPAKALYLLIEENKDNKRVLDLLGYISFFCLNIMMVMGRERVPFSHQMSG